MKTNAHNLRILVTGITADPPGATYGPRVANNYELIWIMEGEVHATFGRTLIQGKEGTILFRYPKVRDYYEWSKRGRTVHAYVQFDILKTNGFKIPPQGVPLFRHMPPNDVLRPLFGYFLRLDEAKGKKINDLMSATLELMLNSYFSGKIEVKALLPSQFPELVERTIEFITRHNEEDPTGKFNLTELSRSVHSSPENLCRLFQKTLHLGPLEYVKMLRLDRAANLLRRSSQSLKEVAAQTGFYDSFHLSKSFKKVYGLSPKDFKASPFNEWICQKNPIIRTLYSRSDLKALSASARSGKS